MGRGFGSYRADRIVAAPFVTYLSGGPERDEAFDQANDTLIGGIRTDLIRGWGGDDLLDSGDARSAWLEGGEGDDVIAARNGSYGLGDEGNDRLERLDALGGGLSGGAGADTLIGGAGGDSLSDSLGLYASNTDVDVMLGGAGDDRLQSDGGADRIDGGDGNDWAVFGRLGETTAVRFRAADGGLLSSDNAFATSVETFSLFGSRMGDFLRGLDGRDSLYGSIGDDLLFGARGGDALYGDDGNDTLVGGAGADKLDGGFGADTFAYGVLSRQDRDEVVYRAGEDRFAVTRGAVDDALPAGALAAEHFSINRATSTLPQFIYFTGPDVLAWDPDGSGAIRPIQIAYVLTFDRVFAEDIVITP